MYGKNDRRLVLDKVKQAKGIVDREWASPYISIKTLSKRVGLDKKEKVLGRVFKEQYNETIRERLRRLRLKESKILLSKNHYPIWFVAKMTGFSSIAYFSYVFHKVENITPGEYKNSIEKNEIISRREMEKIEIKN